jgi:Arc/MetJ family transcription regulator
MNARTNIVIDDELIAQAMERAGVNTKKAAVEAALRAYVRKPDYKALLAAEGSRLISDDYDPKSPAPRPAKAAKRTSKPAPSVTAGKARRSSGPAARPNNR